MSATKCHCGAPAEVYAGGPNSGDWADHYCQAHLPNGFTVWDRLGNPSNDRELARALQATKKTHGRDSMINDLAALLEAHKKGKKA